MKNMETDTRIWLAMGGVMTGSGTAVSAAALAWPDSAPVTAVIGGLLMGSGAFIVLAAVYVWRKLDRS
jgi:hypothetical protein